MKTKLGILVVLVSIACTFAGCSEKSREEIDRKPDLKVNAEDLEHTIVTPHLEAKIEPGKNVLWCSTFQLAWNELCDLEGGPIAEDPAVPMVAVLNKRTASKDDLDEGSYVAMAGRKSQGIYDKIRTELAEKFEGQASPELLDSVPEQDLVAYGYLFKTLPFEWAFERSDDGMVFEGYHVDCFGITDYFAHEKDKVRMAGQVAVLDYQNDDDFIVELTTRAKDDRLILAKVPAGASLGETIEVVQQRVAEAQPTKIRYTEPLRVPVLNFDILREYSELYQWPGEPGFVFAGQSIRFRLDETGAVLKSEAVTEKSATRIPPIIRHLVFDKPFLIMLKRRNADNPYFALWVGNSELLLPVDKKPAPAR